MGYQGRKYFPHVLTTHERTQTKKCLRALAKRASARRALWSVFVEFCQKNGLNPLREANTVGFVIQLRAALAPRTIKLYLGRLIRCFNERTLQGESVERTYELLGLLAGQRLLCTVAARRYAVDITDELAARLILALVDKNSYVAMIVLFMWHTGLRYADLQYLAWTHLRLGDYGTPTIVDVRRSKNIRSDWQRRELLLPNSLTLRMETHVLLRTLKEEHCWRFETVAPTTCTVTELNKYLKDCWHDLGSPPSAADRPPTSYTFRRSAFRRFIACCRGSDGLIDWKRASRFSLHFNEKTLEAFYHDHIGDRSEDEE